MPSFSHWSLAATLLVLLCSQGSGEEVFEVYMWPENLLAEPRGSLTINCSTNCAKPSMGGVETTLDKTLLEEQPQWKLYLLSNISEDTILHCYFFCFGEQRHKSSNVTVYYPPNQVILKLQPTWAVVGKPFTLECRVLSVAPLKNLTLTLLRDKKILSIQTFPRATSVPQEAIATLNVTAHREDGQHNFSCQAELHLGSLGGDIIRRSSEPQRLQVYEPIKDKQMIIIISVISVLLFLFVMAVLFCFAFGQHWHQKRMGTYGVRVAWQGLLQPTQA